MSPRTEKTGEPWALKGDLTFDEVPACYQASLAWRRDPGLPDEIDLAGVERADSSALALVIEWMSWARRDGRSLRLANPPRSLRVYASLTDTDELLGWPAVEDRGAEQ